MSCHKPIWEAIKNLPRRDLAALHNRILGHLASDCGAVEVISRECGGAFGVTLNELISRRRPDRIAWPRMTAMSIALEFFPSMPAEDVGVFFQKDRSAAYHAMRAVENRCLTEKDFASKVEMIRARCKLLLGLNRDETQKS